MLNMLRVLLAAMMLLPIFEAGAAEPKASVIGNALKTAREQKRVVFLEFMSTGCSHCEDFKAKVLDSVAFKKFADANLVPVILDFNPDKPYPQVQEYERDKLAEIYKVQYTPTIFLLSAEGKVLTRMEGYGGESVEKVLSRFAAAVK